MSNHTVEYCSTALIPSCLAFFPLKMWIIYVLNTFACKYFYIKYIIECRYLHVKMYFHNTLSLPTNLASPCSSNLRKTSFFSTHLRNGVPKCASEPDSLYENSGVCFFAFDPVLFVFTNAYQGFFNDVLSIAFYQDMKGGFCCWFFPTSVRIFAYNCTQEEKI